MGYDASPAPMVIPHPSKKLARKLPWENNQRRNKTIVFMRKENWSTLTHIESQALNNNIEHLLGIRDHVFLQRREKKQRIFFSYLKRSNKHNRFQ
jgi:hypothetical protein